MPIINCENYIPPYLFKNGHYNTIYPALFRRIKKPAYTRERIDTLDGDFLDIDLLRNKNNKVAFLFHGLEGNTDSQYIKAISHKLHKENYDIIATNFRGCSGEANNKLITYHSGFTQDVRFIINNYAKDYDESNSKFLKNAER